MDFGNASVEEQRPLVSLVLQYNMWYIRGSIQTCLHCMLIHTSMRGGGGAVCVNLLCPQFK